MEQILEIKNSYKVLIHTVMTNHDRGIWVII